VVLIIAVAGLAMKELRFRSELTAQIKKNDFALWAGYSDPFSACTAPDMDAARGRVMTNARLGHMKPDQDVSFWWFDGKGNVLHEAVFHTNNVGLMSKNNYDPDLMRGEFRIVVLGDEMTAASTASVQWPDLLENEMNGDPSVRARLGTVRVFNFGHPDVSVAQMAMAWERMAHRFKPDLVLVNLVYHSFDRLSEAYYLCKISMVDSPNNSESGKVPQVGNRSAQSKVENSSNPPLPEYIGHVINYTAPGGGKAWMSIFCHGADRNSDHSGRRLRDPNCDAGRPFALWLSPDLAHDREQLAAVQRQIVDDYVDGVLWKDRRPLWLASLFGWPVGILEGRTLQSHAQESDEAGMQQKTHDERVAFVRTYLRRIADSHPDVMVIQNPYYPEVTSPLRPFPLSRRLAELEPNLTPLDMRELLPLDADPQEVRSWWQVPIASEKWSSRGQQVYARAAKAAVLRHLEQRGRVRNPAQLPVARSH